MKVCRAGTVFTGGDVRRDRENIHAVNFITLMTEAVMRIIMSGILKIKRRKWMGNNDLQEFLLHKAVSGL